MSPAVMEIPKHFLVPCTIFSHREAHLVTTLLGSCVAVCLWDPRLAQGGINHFMLPLWNGEGLATPKYGNIAIANLLERMMRMGSRPEDLVAKVFGGGKVLEGAVEVFNMGERNIAVSLNILARQGIPVVAMDVGGERSRKIVYNTASGRVHLWQSRTRPPGGEVPR